MRLKSQLIHNNLQTADSDKRGWRDELQTRYESNTEQKLEGRALRQHVMLGVLLGHVSDGKALGILRSGLLKLTQSEYAKLAGVGRKTLSDIENDRGNFSMSTMKKVYRPVGLTVGLQPVELDFLLEVMGESI